MPSPPPPLVLADRYKVMQVIGEGGYGVVYRGLDRNSQRPVAIKVLSATATKDADAIERMVREQQAMTALAGSGTVHVLDLCESPTGQLCLVMEWLDGEDLEQHLQQLEAGGGHIAPERLLSIVSAVCNTLQRAHQIGIVHRDIKPANVFLTGYSGSVRLLDFGLSRMRWNKTLTQVGMVMGSPSYIAPETWSGDSKLVDHRADLYAVGVVVFRALSGQFPFGNCPLAETMIATTSAPRPSLRKWRPDLPRSIDPWVKKALAVDPTKRFQSAEALADALAIALQGSKAAAALQAALPASLDELQQTVTGAFSSAAALLKRFTDLAKTSVLPAPSIDPNATTQALPQAEQVKAKVRVRSELLPQQSSHIGDWLKPSDLKLQPALEPDSDELVDKASNARGSTSPLPENKSAPRSPKKAEPAAAPAGPHTASRKARTKRKKGSARTRAKR